MGRPAHRCLNSFRSAVHPNAPVPRILPRVLVLVVLVLVLVVLVVLVVLLLAAADPGVCGCCDRGFYG